MSLRALAWKTAVVLGVAAGGLWVATHGVAGVGWGDVAAVLRGVTARQFGVLALIWLGGLGIYSLVLSAALPGLGVRRSLLLNLSGSAVANVIPFGGAVATALNWRMVRLWGHSNVAFVAFCVLTNALDVMTKLALPIVAVAALVAISMHVPAVLWAVAGGCAAVLLLAGLGHPLLLRPAKPAEDPDRRWRRVVQAHVRDSGTRIRDLVASHWPRLLPAAVGYIAAQVTLLYFCLQAVGLEPSVTVVLAAAAIERLGTLVPVTPAGTGVAEIGTIGWLVAAGLDPVDVVAGVLLYRVFLVIMEVPVGGVLLAGWAGRRRVATRRAAAEVLT